MHTELLTKNITIPSGNITSKRFAGKPRSVIEGAVRTLPSSGSPRSKNIFLYAWK